MDNLGNRVALGAIWMVAMRLAVRSIGLISTLILLRLLAPSDFGLVAMVMAVVAIVDTLRQFGFSIALIQNQNAVSDDYDTVWTMEVILAAASAMLIVLVANPAARFYSEPALVPLFYVIATAVAIHGFENVGIVDFRKNLEFDREFLFTVIVRVIGFVVTLSAAFWLRSYWALVIGIVSMKLISTVLSYVMHPYRPRFSLSAIGRLFNFSKWMFLYNTSNLIRLSGPDFVIGKLAGTTGLGLFSISHEISNLPTTELVAPINRALFPGFSKISADKARISSAFVRVASVMALVSLPAAFGIAATADLIGVVVLGEKWLAAIPLLKILAFCGAVAAIMSPITSTLISIGKPKVVALLTVCNAVVLIPAIVFSVWKSGITGAAIAMLANSLFFLPVYLGVAAKFLEIKPRDIMTIFFRPAISSIAMFFVVTAPHFETSSNLANLLISVLVGAITYTVVVFILWIPSGRTYNSGETYLAEKFLGYPWTSNQSIELVRSREGT